MSVNFVGIYIESEMYFTIFINGRERIFPWHYLGHSAHATNKDDFPDITFLNFGVLKGFLTRLDSPLYEVLNYTLELGSGQFKVHMLWTRLIHGEVGQVDVSLQNQITHPSESIP